MVYGVSWIFLPVSIGLTLLYLAKEFYEWLVSVEPETKKILVFGPTGSGKTTWYEFIRTGEIVETQGTIGKEEMPSFVYKRSNGEEVTIQAGYDFAGDEPTFMTHVKPELEKSEKKTVFFFYNGEKFENEKDYEGLVVAYLGHICKTLQGQVSYQLYVFMSFSNKLENPELSLGKSYKLLSNKVDKLPDFKSYWRYVNMKNLDEMNKLKEGLKL